MNNIEESNQKKFDRYVFQKWYQEKTEKKDTSKKPSEIKLSRKDLKKIKEYNNLSFLLFKQLKDEKFMEFCKEQSELVRLVEEKKITEEEHKKQEQELYKKYSDEKNWEIRSETKEKRKKIVYFGDKLGFPAEVLAVIIERSTAQTKRILKKVKNNPPFWWFLHPKQAEYHSSEKESWEKALNSLTENQRKIWKTFDNAVRYDYIKYLNKFKNFTEYLWFVPDKIATKVAKESNTDKHANNIRRDLNAIWKRLRKTLKKEHFILVSPIEIEKVVNEYKESINKIKSHEELVEKSKYYKKLNKKYEEEVERNELLFRLKFSRKE